MSHPRGSVLLNEATGSIRLTPIAHLTKRDATDVPRNAIQFTACIPRHSHPVSYTHLTLPTTWQLVGTVAFIGVPTGSAPAGAGEVGVGVTAAVVAAWVVAGEDEPAPLALVVQPARARQNATTATFAMVFSRRERGVLVVSNRFVLWFM